MKNLLFDLDGTIIEPKEGILNSIRHAAQKMGVLAPSDEELHQFIGPPIMESFQHKLGLTYEQALEAVGYFRSYYAHTGIHQNALFPLCGQIAKGTESRRLYLVCSHLQAHTFCQRDTQRPPIERAFCGDSGLQYGQQPQR